MSHKNDTTRITHRVGQVEVGDKHSRTCDKLSRNLEFAMIT